MYTNTDTWYPIGQCSKPHTSPHVDYDNLTTYIHRDICELNKDCATYSYALWVLLHNMEIN